MRYTIADTNMSPVATIINAVSRTHAFRDFLQGGGRMRVAGLWVVEGAHEIDLIDHQAEFFTPADYWEWQRERTT